MPISISMSARLVTGLPVRACVRACIFATSNLCLGGLGGSLSFPAAHAPNLNGLEAYLGIVSLSPLSEGAFFLLGSSKALFLFLGSFEAGLFQCLVPSSPPPHFRVRVRRHGTLSSDFPCLCLVGT